MARERAPDAGPRRDEGDLPRREALLEEREAELRRREGELETRHHEPDHHDDNHGPRHDDRHAQPRFVFVRERGPGLAATTVALVGIAVGAIIGIAVLLYDFGLSDNVIARGILDISRFLIQPFRGLVRNDNFKVQVTINSLIAAAVYVAVGLLLARLIQRLTRTRRNEAVVED